MTAKDKCVCHNLRGPEMVKGGRSRDVCHSSAYAFDRDCNVLVLPGLPVCHAPTENRDEDPQHHIHLLIEASSSEIAQVETPLVRFD